MSVSTNNESKKRLQFDLTPTQAARFDATVEDCEFGSRKDLFNAAMNLFAWAVGETAKGRAIGSHDSDPERFHTVIIPGIDTAALARREGRDTARRHAETVAVSTAGPDAPDAPQPEGMARRTDEAAMDKADPQLMRA